ncbi:unnamed protein product [Lactuca virosa]|uniref:S1 motif domain-containing protein n=1 Tax=Lactuca virosa TaxID=75947 RepID=A0AAU9NXJ1_9ASTR|nr:unnamed protein product [Lactuca virosa]
MVKDSWSPTKQNLWSKENFTTIADSVGRVIIPFGVDISNANLAYGKVGVITNSLSYISSEPIVEINGETIKIKIVKVDLGWTPFKQYEKSLEDNSSSDDGEEDVDDMEGDDEDEHVSDTIPIQNNIEELEEGEIGTEEGTELN